jgi:tryptophan-rich sensory protein
VNTAFLQYLKPLALATLIASLLLVMMQTVFMHDASKLATFWVIPVFYFMIYAAFHYGLLMSANDGQGFIRYYMAATFFKLLILLAIIISYSLFNKSNATAFVVNFMFSYFVFMTFEVIYLRSKFGKNAHK